MSSEKRLKLILKEKTKKPGRNRSRRYVKHSVLAKQARTMTGRRLVVHENELNALPSGGISSCFLKDVLEEENLRNPSSAFSKFYRELFTFVQSQALLLHNLENVVKTFVKHLDYPDSLENVTQQTRKIESLGLPSILRMVTVLAKDISADVLVKQKYFELLLDACFRRVHPGNVEISTLAFQAVGDLIEMCTNSLLENDPTLSFQTSRYSMYLGSSSEMIRNLSSETFAYMIRKQEHSLRKRHIWSMLKVPFETFGDGIARTLFYVVKGVQGKFHSNVEAILSSILKAIGKLEKMNENVENNVYLWTEMMRKYCEEDYVKVLEILVEACVSYENLGEKINFLFRIANPWIIDVGEIGDDVKSQFIPIIQKRLDCIQILEKDSLLFVLDLWNSFKMDSDEFLMIGELLQNFLKRKPLNSECYHESLQKVDFLSQFVPFLLPQVPEDQFMDVWTQISSNSQKHFEEDPANWQVSFAIDGETRNAFSLKTGQVSESFAFRRKDSLGFSALNSLNGSNDEIALLFLLALAPDSGKQRIISDKLQGYFVSCSDPKFFGLAAKVGVMREIDWIDDVLIEKLKSDHFSHFTSSFLLDSLMSSSKFKKDQVAMDRVISCFAFADASIRTSALRLMREIRPNDSFLESLESIHGLEVTWENERPRQSLVESLSSKIHLKDKLSKNESILLCYGILGMFHIRYQPTWPLAASLLELVCKKGTSDVLFDVCLLAFLKSSTAYDEEGEKRISTSKEQVFSSFLTAIFTGDSLTRLFHREAKKWLNLFFKFLRDEYYPSRKNDILDQEILEQIHILAGESNTSKIPPSSLTRKRLTLWLEVFAAMKGKEIVQQDLLKKIVIRMLVNTHSSEVALKCLFNWMKHLEEFRSCLEPLAAKRSESFRDSLTEITSHLMTAENPELITVTSNLLFGKLVHRPTRSDRFSLGNRRTAIFSAFASLNSEEKLVPLFKLLFQCFNSSSPSKKSTVLRDYPEAAEGFLNLMKDGIKILSSRLLPFLSKVIEGLCYLIRESCFGNEDGVHPDVQTRVRGECFDRFSEIVEKFGEVFDFSQVYETVLSPAVNRLCLLDTSDNVSSLLNFVSVSLKSKKVAELFLSGKESPAFEYLLSKYETTRNEDLLEAALTTLQEVLEKYPQFLTPYTSSILTHMSKRPNLNNDRELSILRRIADNGLINESLSMEMVYTLITLLTSYIDKRPSRFDEVDPRGQIFETIHSLLLSDPLKSRVEGLLRERLAMLFGPASEGSAVLLRGARQSLVKLYSSLSKNQNVNDFLTKTNSWMSSKMDQRDFDTILQVYQETDVSGEAVVINQAMQDMQSEDFALRTVAQAFIINGVKNEMNDDVVDVLSKSIRTSLKTCKDVTIRSLFLMVLRKLVELCPSKLSHRVALHTDMACLLNKTDLEQDFFLNASHVQTARRGRIFTRMNKHLDPLTEESIRFILLPLALHGVLDEQASRAEVEPGIALTAACAARIKSTEGFVHLLGLMFKRIQSASERKRQRFLIKCATLILDSCTILTDELRDKFLPQLFKYLIQSRTKESDEELNENVALSLLRLTKTPEDMDRLILQVCGQLKRRKQSARDTARTALVKISKQLGVEYFPRIFEHLTSCLNEGGFQVHVLGYTLFLLVDSIKEDIKTNLSNGGEARDFKEFRSTSLDSVLDRIMTILEEEMFGEGAATAEKGYKSKLQLREVRAGKCWDTLESLASCIAFLPCDSIHRLTKPIIKRALNCQDVKIENKCRDAFVRIKSGLLKNGDVRLEHLLIYCQHTVSTICEERTQQEEDHNLQSRNWLREREEKGSSYASRLLYQPGTQLTGKNAEKKKEISLSVSQHILLEFVLDLCNSFFFKKDKEALDEEIIKMIIPFVDLLIDQLILKDTTSKRALVLALRICTYSLDWINSEQKKKLAGMAIHFVKQNSKSSVVTADVSKASVDLIACLLKQDDGICVEEAKVLIRVCRIDLDDPNRISSALNLLQLIFNRKVMLPEMYDVALRLTHLIYQAANKSKLQKKSAEILNFFLMEYPLEEKRIKEHVDLILKNLDFEHEEGRISGVNMLRAIISNFPVEFVDESCELFFLPLVLRLVNDNSTVVKSNCHQVALILSNKIGLNKFQILNQLILGWFNKGNTTLVACLSSGIMLETKRPISKEILAQYVKGLTKCFSDFDSLDHDIVYQSLLAFEQLVRRDKSYLKEIDRVLNSLLLHSHLWVRLSSSRLVKMKLDGFSKQKSDALDFDGFDLLLVLIDQLDSDIISEEMAELTLTNLQLLLPITKSHPKLFSKQANVLEWLIKRICLISNRNEHDADLKNRRRMVVFNLFIDLIQYIPTNKVEILEVITKAVTKPTILDANLKEIGEKILDKLKNHFGMNSFVDILNRIRVEKADKQGEKRKQKDLEKLSLGSKKVKQNDEEQE